MAQKKSLKNPKEVIGSRKWKNDRQHNGQKKGGQCSTKHYTTNQGLSNTNATNNVPVAK